MKRTHRCQNAARCIGVDRDLVLPPLGSFTAERLALNHILVLRTGDLPHAWVRPRTANFEALYADMLATAKSYQPTVHANTGSLR